MIPICKRSLFFGFILFFLSVFLPAFSSERIWFHSFSGNRILYFTPPDQFQLLSEEGKITEFSAPSSPIEDIAFNSQDDLALKSEGFLFIDTQKDGTFNSIRIPSIRFIRSFPHSEDFFVATDREIFRIEPLTSKKEVLYRDETSGREISGFVYLPDNRLVIAHRNNWEISIVDLKFIEPSRQLIAHKSGVFFVQADRSGNLFSLDGEGALNVWKPSLQKVDESYSSIFPPDFLKINAVDYDEYRKMILIDYATPQNPHHSFALKTTDLLSGELRKIPVSLKEISPYKLLYGSEDPKVASPEPQPKKPKATEPDYLSLAKIEIENGNFLRALEFTNRIPESSSSYPEARKLANRVQRMRQSQSFLEQGEKRLKLGKTSEALYFFKLALEKDPENAKAKSYLAKHQPPNIAFFSGKILIALAVFIAAFLLWFYRKRLFFSGAKKKSSEKSKKQEPSDKTSQQKEKIKKPETQSRTEEKKSESANRPGSDPKNKLRFEQLLQITKSILQNSMSLDTDKSFEESWKIIYREINRIEQKGAEKDADFSSLIITLNQIQSRISQLQQNLFKKNTKQNSRKNSETQKENYYEILEVSRNATPEEIKKAYRKKVKEYHPDKHRNTDFEWVKNEAEKKMRLLQEALEVLSDPQKRKAYDRKL